MTPTRECSENRLLIGCINGLGIEISLGFLIYILVKLFS